MVVLFRWYSIQKSRAFYQQIRRLSYIISVFLLICVPANAETIKSESLLFQCPHLHNQTMQKLSPMTQGRDGWFFRKVELRDNYALLPETQRSIARLVRAFDYFRGAQLVLVAVPPKAFMASAYLVKNQPLQRYYNVEKVEESYQTYLQSLEMTGALVVNPIDWMTENNNVRTGGEESFYFKRDHHWTPYGAEVTARAIAERLQKLPNYAALPKQTYTTEEYSREVMKHIMAQELQRLCEQNMPAEAYRVYTTYPEKRKGAMALFGDEQTPSLIMLGSSFSAMEAFNFSGFVSQYTGLPVANYAISAGQLFNALLSFATKPKEKVENADFVLWEILPQYDFNNNSRQFRQIEVGNIWPVLPWRRSHPDRLQPACVKWQRLAVPFEGRGHA